MSSYGGNFPTQAHFEMITRGERALNRVRPLITKAAACGVDCAEFEAGHAGLTEFFASVRREFFPDQLLPPAGSGIEEGPQ
jgi:hypothetical protein